jgi:hypothetical protein
MACALIMARMLNRPPAVEPPELAAGSLDSPVPLRAQGKPLITYQRRRLRSKVRGPVLSTARCTNAT